MENNALFFLKIAHGELFRIKKEAEKTPRILHKIELDAILLLLEVVLDELSKGKKKKFKKKD